MKCNFYVIVEYKRPRAHTVGKEREEKGGELRSTFEMGIR